MYPQSKHLMITQTMPTVLPPTPTCCIHTSQHGLHVPAGRRHARIHHIPRLEVGSVALGGALKRQQGQQRRERPVDVNNKVLWARRSGLRGERGGGWRRQLGEVPGSSGGEREPSFASGVTLPTSACLSTMKPTTASPSAGMYLHRQGGKWQSVAGRPSCRSAVFGGRPEAWAVRCWWSLGPSPLKQPSGP